jgi:UPF0397 protein LJ_1703
MEEKSIKKVVAMGIGAAVYIVLSRFAAIPTPIPNTTLQVTYAFLALMAFIYGPITGLGIALIGHVINDILVSGMVWFSWVAAAVFFGFGMGILGKIIKPENFNSAKIVKFIVGNIIISGISWGILAPILDIAIYKEPQGKVFVQGFAAALSNASVVAILGTILIFAFSKTIVSKGSLKQE